MSSIIFRAIRGTVVIAGAGAGLIFGGYALSSLLIPAWPQDYHATVGIALMALGLIGYAGWVAMQEPEKTSISKPDIETRLSGSASSSQGSLSPEQAERL